MSKGVVQRLPGQGLHDKAPNCDLGLKGEVPLREKFPVRCAVGGRPILGEAGAARVAGSMARIHLLRVAVILSILAGIERLQLVDYNFELLALFALLRGPLIKLKVALQIKLGPPAARLFNAVGQGAIFTAIECLTIKPDWLVFPLAFLLIFLSVVDRKPKLGNLATVRELPDLGIHGKPTNQGNTIQIRHNELALS